MNLLPVTSDIQVIELAYSLCPTLLEQTLEMNQCTSVRRSSIMLKTLAASL
jgi:hypothetical protein